MDRYVCTDSKLRREQRRAKVRAIAARRRGKVTEVPDIDAAANVSGVDAAVHTSHSLAEDNAADMQQDAVHTAGDTAGESGEAQQASDNNATEAED